MLNYLLLDGEASSQSSSTGSLIIMGVLIVAIIGLFVWQSYSNKKKRKQAEETVRKLKIGDRVKTIGGVCGFIAELNEKENTFVLKTGLEGKESYVKFDMAAIYQTAPANAVAEDSTKEEKKEDKTEKEEKSTIDKVDKPIDFNIEKEDK